MMIYGKTEPTDIYDVDAILYVQKTQLERFRQKLATHIAIANVAQAVGNKNYDKSGISSGSHHYFHGRGIPARGRWCCRNTTGSRPTCQLCNK